MVCAIVCCISAVKLTPPAFLYSLVAVKLLLGTNLVSYASHRYSTMDQREREEELNARDRQPIGVDKDEKVGGMASKGTPTERADLFTFLTTGIRGKSVAAD